MQIQVLKKTSDILDILSANKGSAISLSEIADSLEINRATCANILKTLVDLDFVCQPDKRKGYTLGRKLFDLTGEVIYEDTLLKFSYLLVDELCERINENVLLSVARGSRRSLLHAANGNHEVEAKTKDNISLYKAVTGRVILAHYDHQRIEEMVSETGLPGDDWPEVKTLSDLFAELERIRSRKYIISTNSHHVLSIAVPIFYHGRVIASLGCYLPDVRADVKHLDFLLKNLMDTAAQINDHLGL